MKNNNRIGLVEARLRTAVSLALVATALAPLGLLRATEGKGEKASKTEQLAEPRSESAGPSNVIPKAAPKKLTGAELYSMHCNRCHPERYPTERTAAQWKTILLHMRVRANLPAEQSRTILKYLQDNSGR